MHDILQKKHAVQAGVPGSIAYNAINQSELLSQADRESFHLEEEGPLHWKLLGAGESCNNVVSQFHCDVFNC